MIRVLEMAATHNNDNIISNIIVLCRMMQINVKYTPMRRIPRGRRLRRFDR